jgi:hypothetical protein
MQVALLNPKAKVDPPMLISMSDFFRAKVRLDMAIGSFRFAGRRDMRTGAAPPIQVGPQDMRGRSALQPLLRKRASGMIQSGAAA